MTTLLEQLHELYNQTDKVTLVVQHEFDDDPDYIVPKGEEDRELLTVMAGNTELADCLALAYNNLPQLLEAVERLEAMQRVIGELASMNPFLRDVFDTNKAVLEKLK